MYFIANDTGKLINANVSKVRKIASTKDTRFIFCKYWGTKDEQMKLPRMAIVNSTAKSSTPMTPKRTPWMTLSNEPEKIVNEQVAAAWIELHPRDLYMGIRKIPPPKPRLL